MKHTLKVFMLAISIFALPLSATLADGKAVYEKTCKKCHDFGVLGAPKPGDKAEWTERGKKGIDTLVSNATNGFKGKNGMMPPKGGNASLSEAEIKQAVQYMMGGS